jgi:predicted Zn-dependent protease
MLVIGLLVSMSLAARSTQWPDANQLLLHSARLWEARQRGDLAQLALKKLVAARPDSPQALIELGELDLRIRDYADAAEVVQQLDQRFAGTPADRNFTLEYRIATRDRVQLASIHRLIELRRTAEARAALDQLFAAGVPTGDLGIEYYELLAATSNGWARASAGLAHLAAEHPDDPRYALALARHWLQRPGNADSASKILHRLATRDDVNHAEVQQLLAGSQRELDIQRRETQDRQYLTSTPSAPQLARLQSQLARELPLPARNPAEAHAGAWLARSRASLSAGATGRATLELRAAFAFLHGPLDATVPVAQALESQGAADEAGELLETAGGLDPKSDWLFESQVRWLIAHGRPGQAVTSLQSRAVGGKWTTQKRDALLAAALDARAGTEAAAGNVDAAIGDLEAAVLLAPLDPWKRFRLANLYSSRRDFARGRAVMNDGAQRAPGDPEMRYAQALYLTSLEDYAAALAAVDGIAAARRTADLDNLHDRIRVALARETARRLKQSGDLEGARAALLEVDAIARRSFERAVDLAYAWIDMGSAEHGIELLEPYCDAAGTTDAHVLMTWAHVLDSALDTGRLQAALDRLRASSALGAPERIEVAQLQRSLDLRVIRILTRDRRFDEAARRLDALLAQDPQDRALRAARADLFLAIGEPRRARDLYASLAAEHPEDLETRLAYIRALTESGDIGLARAQLAAVQDKIPAADEELQVNLARRQLALDDGRAALATLRPLLRRSPPRSDVLLLAAQAARAMRDFATAREYFARAEGAADPADAATARRAREEIDARLDAGMTAGLMVRHQPGDAGESRLDVVTVPTSWVMPLDYEHRLTARADAVTLDAGRAGSDALLGTIPSAGAGAPQRYVTGEQSGMSLAGGYRTDSLAADIGTTPLGFLLTNVVGGVDWTPHWNAADLTLGLARRAVTNSELSFAGLKDPVTGMAWGGVVQTGAHAGIGLYRERFGISGSLEYDELTGTHVPDNQFLGARIATDWKFFSRVSVAADAGLTLDYWNYKRNLSNYTFGNGGYYSPQSYVSFAIPVELNGSALGWNYRLRVSPSYTLRDLQTSAFYPTDDALQVAAAHAALPAGYAQPYFPSDRSNSIGIYALAATEREVTRGLVVGAMLEIDRTDYYHPTTFSVYIRHAFGQAKTHATYPVQPVRPYSP